MIERVKGESEVAEWLCDTEIEPQCPIVQIYEPAGVVFELEGARAVLHQVRADVALRTLLDQYKHAVMQSGVQGAFCILTVWL